jgi:hypothetical protein
MSGFQTIAARQEAEQALLAGESCAVVGKRYGITSTHARVLRNRAKHREHDRMLRKFYGISIDVMLAIQPYLTGEKPLDALARDYAFEITQAAEIAGELLAESVYQTVEAPPPVGEPVVPIATGFRERWEGDD